jgi:hypothetical protein
VLVSFNPVNFDSAFPQPHLFVVANQHKEPTQHQEDNDHDGAGRRLALKCLEMHPGEITRIRASGQDLIFMPFPSSA